MTAHPALVARAQALAGVLHDGQAVFGGQRQDGIHVRRGAEDVDRHDGRDAPTRRAVGQDPVADDALLGEEAPHALDVHVAVLIAVDEDRPGAHVADRVDRGDERHRGHDDLVVGLDAGQHERDVDGRGARIAGDDVLDAEVGRQHLLHLRHEFAVRGDPAGRQAAGDVLELATTEGRLGQRDHGRPRLKSCGTGPRRGR